MKPELIESPGRMGELLVQLNGCDLIAVDTEFFRETTYFPQLALVQIATDTLVACIDPLAFDARPYLKKLLLEPATTKIFHSCSQDLEVLFYYLGEAPSPIYDTQLANALLSEHPQIGYAALVENELGVQLDKSQTRTNWLQRPLTEKQINYAGDDVLYLYQLHEILDAKLQETGRKTWFDEDSSRLYSDKNCFQVAEENLWKRVKGSTRLNRQSLASVQAIAIWREQLAQNNDKTRRRVLPDDLVLQLALSPPENLAALSQSIGPKYTFDDKAKQQLLEAIVSAQQSTADSWPDNRFNSLDSQQKTLLKSLQQLVNSKAEELGISSAILCSRKDLEKLILTGAEDITSAGLQTEVDLDIIRGWRYRCIGQQLIEAIVD